MEKEKSLSLATIQTDFKGVAKQYLDARCSDNEAFQVAFIKTGTDLLFSQSDEMMEKLLKTKPQSLMNAIFVAAELGASFAKKEIHFIPYEISKTEIVNGVKRTTKTGEYSATVVPDINFQKQQIMKLENCKKFFTAEIYDGVQPIKNLITGNWEFDGKNDPQKQTIGYYSKFFDVSGEIIDLFLTNAEIIDRAKYSPQYKAENYANPRNNIHYEKIVVRNISKEIPKISETLKSTISMEFTEYEVLEVSDDKKPNALEEAKKEIAGKPKKEVVESAPTNNEAAFLNENAPDPEKPKTQTSDLF